MILDQGARHFDESPTVHRILQIDEEMAALDRVRPRTRYLLYGGSLLTGFLLWAVTLVAAGSDAAEPLLRVTILVTIPSIVFALQLVRNRHRRHKLEQELDTIVTQPHKPPALEQERDPEH